MKAFLVVVVLLGALAAGADWYFTGVAEERAGAEVSARLRAPVTVDLRGWPVSLRLLLGSVPEVAFAARDVPLQEVEGSLQLLEATLQDVRLDPAALSGADLVIEARAGTFLAVLDQATVAALARGNLDGVSIELGAGTARVGVPQLGGVGLDTAVAVEDGQVVMRMTGLPGQLLPPLRLDLPVLPGGATVTTVEILPGRLVVHGTVTRLDLSAVGGQVVPAG